MPRIISSLILSAAFGAFVTPALADTEGALLDGTWLGVGDMLGLLPGHLEVLSIDGDRVQSVIWVVPPADCPAGACPLPVPSLAGAVAATSFDLTVTADAGTTSPFADLPAGPLLGLPGDPWTMFRQEDQLMLTREASVNGTNVPLLRMFLAVDPAFPEPYFDYLVAMDLDIARTVCPLTLLHANPDDWSVFAALLAEAAPALHADRLRATGEEPGDPVPAGAVAAVGQLQAWVAGTGPLAEGKALLPALPVPAPSGLVQPARDCLAQVFGD